MSRIHGVADLDLAAAVCRIRDDESLDSSAEVFARVAWSGIAEPGDRVAGDLLATLGAVDALNSLIDRREPDDLARAVFACGSYGKGHIRGDSRVADDMVDDLRQAIARWSPRLRLSDVMGHFTHGAHVSAGVVLPGDIEWPRRLDDLGAHRPALLWFRGERDRFAHLAESISLVGARASTGYGEHVTMEFAQGLVEHRMTVVSGAAYGVDGMAHRSTLAAEGHTVAVLAGGVDRLYPSGHDTLLRRIIDAGLVVSELPIGFAPTKWRFLQRNRLIAALGRATVVVEAGWRSGSLNTAHHALALERPVGAVPGPVTSASSAGCHRLLRETPALCVTSVEDVLVLAGVGHGSEHYEHSGADDWPEDAIRVRDALSTRRPRSIEDIARESGLSSHDVRSHLGLAILRDAVRETPQGWVRVA